MIKRKNVRKKGKKHMQHTTFKNSFRCAFIVLLIGVIISGCATQSKEEQTTTLIHIHGLGYSSDGQRILIPAHDGLKMYSKGSWSEGPGDKHDYMGFTMVDTGFYSSGHPALDSNLENPLGIIKSSDEGKSMEHLDLYGEIDFHLLSASYNSHTIYALNPEPNSRLSKVGLYYSKDDAKNWNQSDMNGLIGEPIAMAVHPTDDAIVAVGTEQALYVSKDYGNRFEKIADLQVTGLSYNELGVLLVGAYQQNGVILEMDPATNQFKELSIPTLVEDAPAYIAQNPIDDQELVFATFKKDVYLSYDKGTNWIKIADQGEGIEKAN